MSNDYENRFNVAWEGLNDRQKAILAQQAETFAEQNNRFRFAGARRNGCTIEGADVVPLHSDCGNGADALQVE